MKSKRVLRRTKAWLIYAMDEASKQNGVNTCYMAYSKVLRNIVSEEIKYKKEDKADFEKQWE